MLHLLLCLLSVYLCCCIPFDGRVLLRDRFYHDFGAVLLHAAFECLHVLL